MSVRIEGNVEITTTYRRVFGHREDPRNSGFGFECDENGNVDVATLKPLAAENYRKCMAGEMDVVDMGVEAYESRVTLCHCNSGLHSEEVFDGHGIYLCRVCDKCKDERLKGFRSDIFDNYQTDEQIEED